MAIFLKASVRCPSAKVPVGLLDLEDLNTGDFQVHTLKFLATVFHERLENLQSRLR